MLVDPEILWTQVRVFWTAGQPRRPSQTIPSRLGELVDTAGNWAWAQVAQETWSTPRTRARVALEILSTPQAIGPDRCSPRKADRFCGPSDQSTSRPGQLVQHVGLPTRA